MIGRDAGKAGKAIYVALGANLPHPVLGPPRAVLEQAVAALEARGLAVVRRSRWYRSRPVPPSGQPWYVNGVIEVAGSQTAPDLMTLLHAVEEDFGRVRSEPNAARVLDLDLLDFHGAVSQPGDWPVLPHPRAAARAFVLLPLRELAPAWRDPASGRGIDSLIAGLPDDQRKDTLPDEP